MAGKGPSQKHFSSSSDRKTRWEANNPRQITFSATPNPPFPKILLAPALPSFPVLIPLHRPGPFPDSFPYQFPVLPHRVFQKSDPWPHLLQHLGFTGGRSKSLFGKEGYMGITVVKFANSSSGLKEAERLADFFEKDNHGRKGWAHILASQNSGDDEKNPNLIKVDEKTGEKWIFYRYLGTASDLDKVDFDSKKKAVIKSRRDFKESD